MENKEEIRNAIEKEMRKGCGERRKEENGWSQGNLMLA